MPKLHNIKPANRIVVLIPKKVSNLGVIEVSEKDQPDTGEVIAVGGSDPKKSDPIKMKIGDMVAYRKFGESKFYMGAKETIFVSFDDILAIIK